MNFEDDLGIKSFDDPKVPQSVRDYLINNLKVDYEKRTMKLIKTKKEYDYHLNKLKDLMKNDMTIPTVKRNFFIDRSILDPRIKNDPMFLGVSSDTVFLSKDQMNDLKSKIKTTSTDSVTTYNPTKGIIQTQRKPLTLDQQSELKEYIVDFKDAVNDEDEDSINEYIELILELDSTKEKELNDIISKAKNKAVKDKNNTFFKTISDIYNKFQKLRKKNIETTNEMAK